jgi:hypothetical protein
MASAASMEAAHFIKTGELLKLSEQQFVDCDTQSLKCIGGTVPWAYQYAQNSPIALEAVYPYINSGQ